MNFFRLFTISVLLLAINACSSDSSEKDLTPPQILSAGDYTSPLNCQEFTLGGYLPFNYVFTDNVELGSFNLEIHNNFDHHTHSTEEEDCGDEHEHEHGQEPVNPWIFNKDYPIPAGSTAYEADFMIPIPEDIDTGEYHFMIRLTDAAGWQQLRSVSIHIH